MEKHTTPDATDMSDAADERHVSEEATAADSTNAPTIRRRRRGRLVAGLLAVGVGAGALAIGTGASTAGARPCIDTNPGWRYRSVQVTGYDFRGVGPVYTVNNASNATATYSISTNTSGTVSATLSVSAEAEIKAAIFGGVKATTGLSVTGAITVSRGETTSVTARPHTRVFAQRGVSRVTTTGTLVYLNRCGVATQSQTVRATSPYSKTWNVRN